MDTHRLAIVTTTPSLEGRSIQAYLGIVTGQAVLGVDFTKDLFASVRDVIGGRAGGYEQELASARTIALDELATEASALGADGVVGVDLDYEAIGQNGSMLMVTAAGTAVRLAPDSASATEMEWQHEVVPVPA
jgi:uncharacterized protein YbjQ (UPF0145 family)